MLTIVHVLSGLLAAFAVSFALPIAWSLAAGDGAHRGFVLVAVPTLLVGALLFWLTRGARRELQPRDGCLLAVLGWVLAAVLAALPLMIEIDGLSFTDAFFESISALTTTASTVLGSLDRLPPSINLWRHAMQWLGGMAIVVLNVAILPLLGVGGMQLLKADTPGPMKEGKLKPRVMQTARALWLLYALATAACAGCLKLAGMSWLDAVCHAFSTLSLGGFSTRDGNVAAFGSPAIEAVLAVFMMVAALNFVTHFVALRRGAPRIYWRDAEVAAVWLLILGSCLALAAYLRYTNVYPSFLEALRYAGFNTVSFATTAGFWNADYASWPAFAPMSLLLLCALASPAASTGGGIRMVRVLVLVRQAGRELVRIVHPRAVTPITINGAIVEQRVVTAVLGFMLLYGVSLIILTFAMLLSGMDFLSAFSSVFSCLNNTGPAMGAYGPGHGYRELSDPQTWVLAVAMLAGRLELLTFFAVFMPGFWRK